MKIPFFRTHARWAEQADAYVDRELDGRSRARYEAHIAGCAACGDAVEGARILRAALRALPEIEAPRSFRLTSATAAGERADVRSAPPARPSRGAWGYRVAQVGSAMAGVALVTVVALDLSAGEGGDTTAADPAGTLAMEAMSTTDDVSATGTSESYLPAESEGAIDSESPPAEQPLPTADGRDDERAAATGSGEADASAPMLAAEEPVEDRDDLVIRALQIVFAAALVTGVVMVFQLRPGRRA